MLLKCINYLWCFSQMAQKTTDYFFCEHPCLPAGVYSVREKTLFPFLFK
jgi:hypothetical protein